MDLPPLWLCSVLLARVSICEQQEQLLFLIPRVNKFGVVMFATQ